MRSDHIYMFNSTKIQKTFLYLFIDNFLLNAEYVTDDADIFWIL